MQRYTIFFITVNVLYVSGGLSAYHQELNNCTHSIGYVSSLLAATASVVELEHCELEYSITLYLVSYTLKKYGIHSCFSMVERNGFILFTTTCRSTI
jgi:hypothetical protein